MFVKLKADKYRKNIIQKDGKTFFRAGELNISEGFPILRLKGSYYDMGLQYGVLLREGISSLYDTNKEREKDILSVLPWYIRPFSSMIMAVVAGYSAKRIPRKYRKELHGLSRGSGIAFNDIAAVAFGGVIFDAACTSVLAGSDSGIIHGQNLDFEPGYLGSFPAVVEYSNPDKFRYMHLGVVGVPGIFHGMNEKGIAVTVNYGDGTFNSKNKGLPMGYKLREILESASKLDDVDRILKESGPDELGWIITVSSASEKSGAVYDIFNDEIIRTDFIDDKYIYVLNRIFDKERTGREDLSKKYLQISRGEGIYNTARADAADSFFSQKNINSVDDVIEFLRSYDFYDYKKFAGSMNATIVNERTLHTIIFNHEEHSVYMASSPGYSSLGRIVKYNFNTGELVKYMEPSPEFNSAELKGFMEWYGKFQDTALVGRVSDGISRKFPFVKFNKPDYSEVLKSIDLTAYHNPRELWSLFRIWKSDRKAIRSGNVIISCEKAVERYPEFAILYIIKGNIHKALRKYDEAAESFEKALQCSIISQYDTIHIYDELVYVYRMLNNRDKTLEYAAKNISLIETLSTVYSPGNIVSDIYTRMMYTVHRS
jgi:hypothetical protein